ncbi:MAG TPA: antibiotic biosynthesis monooxygenase [Ktedonobacteraceae bacterium]|nr:antibiotic biosynthesis monooxygenase [Ktedonobacteraceae bacterium]
MELLVATLAYTTTGRDADILARIRLIADTVRTAPGLISSRFYRSRGKDAYYLMLTTWDDDESWHNAQEKYGPKQLLTTMATELLTSAPEQWLMRYLWGYSRPAASPVLAAAHLAHIRKEQAEYAELGWIEKLRQQAVQSTLAFAFLARGMQEETFAASRALASGKPTTAQSVPYHQGSVLLNLFSWGSESEREEFYADPNYQAINRFVTGTGSVRVLSLEPM